MLRAEKRRQGKGARACEDSSMSVHQRTKRRLLFILLFTNITSRSIRSVSGEWCTLHVTNFTSAIRQPSRQYIIPALYPLSCPSRPTPFECRFSPFTRMFRRSSVRYLQPARADSVGFSRPRLTERVGWLALGKKIQGRAYSTPIHVPFGHTPVRRKYQKAPGAR